MEAKRIIIAMLVFALAPIAQAEEKVQSAKLDPIVVTPTRYEASPHLADTNVTVLSQADISRYQAKTVPELLRRAVGVNVRDFMGNGKSVNVDMRGFGESAAQNVLVLVDGRRTNQVDMSGADWSQIDINSVDHIEVVSGPQTVLYGDNATAGVINIVTKKGSGKPAIGVDLATGSYKYRAMSVNISGGSSFLDYYGSAAYLYTDGFRTNSDLDSSNYVVNLTAKPTDVVRLNMRSGYHNDWYGMPGALSRQSIDQFGVRGSTHPHDRAKTEDKFITVGPDLTWKIGPDTVNAILDCIFRGRRTSTRTFPGPWENENHIITRALTPRVNYSCDIFGHENKLLAGLDYYYDRDNILSGDPTSASGKDLIVIEKESLGIYATDTFGLTDKLYATLGARGEWANYDFDQQSALKGTDERKPSEYAWNTGLSYRYNDKSSLYANAGRSFRFPAVDEWYNALWSWWGIVGGGLNMSLKPQTQMSYEVGIKDNTFRGITLASSLYYMDVRKELFYNPLTYANDTYDHTCHRGFTVDAHTHPLVYFLKNGDVDIDLFGRYNYDNAYFIKGSFAGNEIPMAPKHRVGAGFNLTYKECVSFNCEMRFVGQSHLISDQLNRHSPLKGYWTNDIQLSYRKYGFEMFGGINNLFDSQYSEYGVMNSAGTVENFYPSTGRNYIVGMKYRF